LTAEEVKSENEASQDSLLDKSKEVEFLYFKVVLTDAGNTKVLVISAVCTHLGCVPIPYLGAFNGWVCICHGSVYDKVTYLN
jgi:ubiquinol-cytochrome c reductase iron-sulfur subunit